MLSVPANVLVSKKNTDILGAHVIPKSTNIYLPVSAEEADRV